LPRAASRPGPASGADGPARSHRPFPCGHACDSGKFIIHPSSFIISATPGLPRNRAASRALPGRSPLPPAHGLGDGAKTPENRQNLPVVALHQLWQDGAGMNGSEKQFSFTRAASSTSGRARKQIPVSCFAPSSKTAPSGKNCPGTSSTRKPCATDCGRWFGDPGHLSAARQLSGLANRPDPFAGSHAWLASDLI
jgi:hypothetical protein